MIKSTKRHTNYWQKRKIDWKTSYLDTANHPHRDMLLQILSRYSFQSLLELGCASGPNLLRVSQQWSGLELGGVDISEDAIKTAKEHLPSGMILDVAPAHNVFISDKSTDVVLTDMCLIYYSPIKIKKAIKEIKRVTRKHVVMCEFHSPNIFKRWGLRTATGYNAYNYKKLLDKYGFHDIRTFKIPEEGWPGGEPQKTFGYFITANL